LFGGLITNLFSYEGSIAIPEGESSNIVSDYHKIEFAVVNASYQDYDEVTSFSQDLLEEGNILRSKSLPFKLKIKKYYRNCMLTRKKSPPKDSLHTEISQSLDIRAIPLSKEYSENRAGLKVKIIDTGVEEFGEYILLEYMKEYPVILVGSNNYYLKLRKKEKILPFQIKLIDFVEKNHPGTKMAKSYKSKVTIIDGNIEQNAIIQMNAPLRYKGYTFYQSSFQRGGNREITVLTVVQNIGRLFPYISSLVICIGLLIHLLLKTPKLFDRKNK
jgi:cytochrome c biogenesis protein ResB